MSTSQNLTVNWTNVPTRTITAGEVEFTYRECHERSISRHHGGAYGRLLGCEGIGTYDIDYMQDSEL